MFLVYVAIQNGSYAVSAIAGLFFVATINNDNKVRYENAIAKSIYKQIGK